MLLSNIARGQQASLDGVKLVYKNFTTRNLDITARGFGFGYRKSKFVQGKDRVLEISGTIIHDPKEGSKVPAALHGQGLKSYYIGKVNNVLALRVGVGSQKVMFAKEVPNAVEFKQCFTVGINAAMLKPIYVQVAGADAATSGIKPYNPLDTTETVLGRASFFNGISKTTINPALFFKYYWQFDFAKDDEVIKAIEVGACVDLYLSKLRILANDNNRRFYTTLYVAYSFGNKYY